MASLKDVEFSLKGEVQQTEISSALTQAEIAGLAMGIAPKIEQQNTIFKLVHHKKGRLHIDGIDDVINPSTGRQERIWLLSGAPSIWSTDLIEMLKDKNYVNNNRISLEFVNGIMVIPNYEQNKMEFIKHCRHFIGNPKRRTGSRMEFFEYDPQKQQEAALQKELLELEMVMKAKDRPVEEMKKHASYLGIVFFDELGQPKTDDGIRREYMLAAKRKPDIFEKTIASKEVEVQFLVKKAILDARIDLGKSANTAYWASGGFISKIPMSRKPLEYLTEYAMTNSQEGKQFLEQLERK